MTTHNIFLCLGFRAPSIRECETIEEYHQYELLFSKMRFEEFPIINSLTDCVRPCQYNEYRLLTEKRPTSFETPHFPVAFSSRTRATTEETEEILYPWYGKCIVQEKVRQHFVGPLSSRRLAVFLDFFLVSPSWPSGTGSFGWGQIFLAWSWLIKANTQCSKIEPRVTNALFWVFQVQEGWASVREKCFGKQPLRRNQITAIQSPTGYWFLKKRSFLTLEFVSSLLWDNRRVDRNIGHSPCLVLQTRNPFET